MRRITGGLLAAGLLLALAGCSGTPDVAEEVYAGVPQGNDSAWENPDLDGAPIAGWIVPGERFAVVTWGSSGCPPVAAKLFTQGSNEIDLTFAPSPNEVCTADFAPTTHEFALPASITDRPVALVVHFEDSDETLTLTLD